MEDTIIKQIVSLKENFLYQKKQAYLQDFYAFNRDVLGWPDLYEPLHKLVCDFVQDNWKRKKLLILLPRGTFKSSIITVGFSLWRIANDSNTRLLISNATYQMAVSFLSQIKKHILGNTIYKEIFGEMYIPSERWREDSITISNEKLTHKEPTIWAYGMGGNLVGSHFNLAILDDVVARENIGTKDQIEKTKDFFRDALDLIDPMAGGHKPMIIVGTTWHYDDLYSWIQDKRNNLLKDFAVLRLPAYEGEWGTGKLLFPKRLTWETMKKLKEQQGNAHFSAQYLLNPIAEEDQVFRQPFPTYEQTDLTGLELNTFMSVDPALTESKSADYSAIVVVSVDANNVWYIRDIWRKQCLPNELINQIFIMDQQWQPISTAMESTAFQKILQYQIYDEMRKRNRFIPIKEIKHGGLYSDSKDERIRSLQPRYEQKLVRHPERQSVPMVEYLEDELSRFPRSSNDDIIDALASMNEIAFPKKVKEERHQFHQAHYPA